MTRAYSDYLRDILGMIDKAQQFVAGMRDKLIHGYFVVDVARVWETVQQDLPPLQQVVEQMLSEADHKSNE